MNNTAITIFCFVGSITFLGMLFILLDIIYDKPIDKKRTMSPKEMDAFEEEAASVYFTDEINAKEPNIEHTIEHNIHSFENDIVIDDSLVVLSGVITDDQTSDISSIIIS